MPPPSLAAAPFVAIAMLPILVFAFVFLIAIAATILWIFTLVDCAVNEPAVGNDKIVWILLIVFTHGIGSLIYLLVRRPKRIQLYGK